MTLMARSQFATPPGHGDNAFGRNFMGNVSLTSFVSAALLALGSAAYAQQPPAAAPAASPPPPPPPYGLSITLEQAKKAIAAAEEEAKKNNWGMNIAVVGSSGHLVAFSRMDNAQL